MQCVDITLEMYGTPLCDKTFSVSETGSQSTDQLVIKKAEIPHCLYPWECVKSLHFPCFYHCKLLCVFDCKQNKQFLRWHIGLRQALSAVS